MITVHESTSKMAGQPLGAVAGERPPGDRESATLSGESEPITAACPAAPTAGNPRSGRTGPHPRYPLVRYRANASGCGSPVSRIICCFPAARAVVSSSASTARAKPRFRYCGLTYIRRISALPLGESNRRQPPIAAGRPSTVAMTNTPFGGSNSAASIGDAVFLAVAAGTYSCWTSATSDLHVGILVAGRSQADGLHAVRSPRARRHAAHPAWQVGHQNRFRVAITSVWISVPQIRHGSPVRR